MSFNQEPTIQNVLLMLYGYLLKFYTNYFQNPWQVLLNHLDILLETFAEAY